MEVRSVTILGFPKWGGPHRGAGRPAGEIQSKILSSYFKKAVKPYLAQLTTGPLCWTTCTDAQWSRHDGT